MDWLNNNPGVVAAIGLFFVVPFAILSQTLYRAYSRRQRWREVAPLALDELFGLLHEVHRVIQAFELGLAQRRPDLPWAVPVITVLASLSDLDLPARDYNLLTTARRNAESFARLCEAWRTLVLRDVGVADDDFDRVYREGGIPMYLTGCRLLTTGLTVATSIALRSPPFQAQATLNTSRSAVSGAVRLFQTMLIETVAARDGRWFATYRTSEAEELSHCTVVVCWRDDAARGKVAPVLEVEALLAGSDGRRRLETERIIRRLTEDEWG